MKIIYKVFVFSLMVASCYTSHSNDKAEKRSGLEVLISPRLSKENLKRQLPEDNIIEAENKAIQLQISSGDKLKNKVDLIIAATKQIQATEEAINRYSPTYNAETDRKTDPFSKNVKNEMSFKNLSPSRNSESLFSPESYGDIIPYADMRSLIPQPLFPFSNLFSPIQNLRNMEQNFHREVSPHSMTTNERNPYQNVAGNIMVAQPVQSYGLVQNNANLPQMYRHTYSIGDNQQLYNQPHSIHHQPIPIIQSSPMHGYPVPLPAPLGRVVENPEQMHYVNINPETNSALPDSYLRSSPKQEIKLVHQGYYAPQTNLENNLPKVQNHLEKHNGRQNEPQHLLLNNNAPYNQANPATLPRVPVNNQNPRRDQIKLLHDILYHNSLRNNPNQNDFRQSNHEQRDRNKHYSPNQQQSLHQKVEEDSRKNGLYQREIFPRPSYRGNNMVRDNQNELNRNRPLQSQLAHRDLPQYTMIPHESLPRYLQEQQHIPNARHRDIKQHEDSHHRLTGSTDQTDGQYGISRDQSKIELRNPSHQRHAVSPNNHEQIRSSDIGLNRNVPEIKRHYPHRNVYPDRSYERAPRLPDRAGILGSRLSNNHAVPTNDRPTYELREVDLENLPRKKYPKKIRKRLKPKQEDFEGQASHQYIIKIR